MEGCNAYLGIAAHATRLGLVSVATIIKALGVLTLYGSIIMPDWRSG